MCTDDPCKIRLVTFIKTVNEILLGILSWDV